VVTRLPTAFRITVAVLTRLLPAGFRQRQHAEWTADLLDLDGRQRLRYVASAAWTLPELRAVIRAGRPALWTARGLRAGLGRPGTSGIVVLAALMSLLGGIFGAGAATRLGWEYVRPLPVGAEAEELKRTAFPGLRVVGGEGASPWGAENAGYRKAFYGIDQEDQRHTGIPVPGVLDRLTAAGWQTTPYLYADPPGLDTSIYGADVRMVRDGLVLRYHTHDTFFTVAPLVPAWMGWFAAAGGIAGALIGWLLTGWVGRRAAEGTIAGQVSSLIVWPTAVFMAAAAAGEFLVFREFGDTNREVFFLQLLYVAESRYPWTLAVFAVGFTVVAVLHGRPRLAQSGDPQLDG
jgi:hypothetical protein